MYKIRLNDGTEFDTRWCGESNNLLTTDIISEQSFLDVVRVFADAEKTSKIVFIHGQLQDEFSGYSKLVVVNGSTTGEYLIILRKA